MRVDIAVLSDYATTTADGKLVIGGVFDKIRVRSFPAVHPSMSLALRVCTDFADKGSHHLGVHLVDPDGQPVVPPLEVNFDVQYPSDLEDDGALQLVLNVGSVKFKAEGPYAVDIFIDNRHEDSVSLRVIKWPQ